MSRYDRLLHLAIIAVAAAALSVGPARGQEKFRLKEGDTAGDKYVMESVFSVQMDIHAKVGDQQQDLKTEKREERTYTRRVISADAKGKPTAEQRFYTLAKNHDVAPGQDARDTVRSLQGNTVLLRRSGNKVTVTPVGGWKLSAEDRADMEKEMGKTGSRMMPDNPVGPGDEWEVPAERLGAMFGGADKAQASCRFEEVVPYAGSRCARVSVKVSVQGPAGEKDDPTKLSMKLAGDLYYSLDLDRLVALDVKGPLTLTGKSTDNGVTVDLAGDGEARINMAAKWLAVAGKPVK